MHIRSSVLRASVLAALSLGVSAASFAQDTTRTSQQRIRITKESRGEVNLRTRSDSAMRADSIARADSMRADSIRADSIARVERMKQDSIAAVERARADSLAAIERARADSIAAIERARRDSIARADSIAAAEQLRREQMRNRYLFNGTGWYIGLAGGTARPRDDFEELGYGNGFNIAVPIGWHVPNHLLGIRLDLGYSQFNGNSFVTGGAIPSTVTNPDPRVLSASLNTTMRFPITQARTTALYLVGGGGIYQFRNFGRTSALSGMLGNDVLDPQDEANNETTKNKLGWNFGGGIDFGVGPASIFLESRIENVIADRGDDVDLADFFGNRSNSVRWLPIVLGVTFR